MAAKAFSLLLLVASLCVVALSKFGMGSRFGNSPPYKPTLPDPQFPPLYGTQEGNNDNAYYDRFDAQGDEYNSGNMRPSVENQYQQPNIQQGSYQNQFDQPASDDFQLEQNQYEEPVYPDTQCRIPNRHLNSIPSGSVKNIHITRLVTKSAVKCLQKCCDLGPKDCQYIWVFKSKCFAVACQKAFASLCRPRKVFDKNAKDTSYYEVAHPEQHNIEIDNGAAITEGPASEPGPLGREGEAPTHQANNTEPGPLGREGEAPTHQVNNTEPGPLGREGEAPTHQANNTEPPTDGTDGTDELSSDEEDDRKTQDHTDRTGFGTGTITTAPTNSESTEPTSDQLGTTPMATTLTPPTLPVPPDHPLENLTIAIDGTVEVVLPDNEVHLFASTWPDPPGVRFHWSRVFGMKEGVLSGMNDDAVVLSELVPGVYGLRVTAQSPVGQFGEAFVNVTVHDKLRKNTPPRAIISPSTNYTVYLPQDTVIFDASQSEDDLGLENLHFSWQQVKGPMERAGESSEALLTLSSPRPGEYRYKLTVTDSDGAPTVAFVDLKVVRERDYPPLANAGSDIVLKVPNSEVILDGSRSTDDKPGLKYRWKNLSEKKLGLDIEGTDSVSLRVSKLTVGVYHFRLTVTDSAGQTDSSEVTVDVLPEKNEPPVAEAGGPYDVRYPTTSVVLDGSGSYDDYEKGMRFSWIQTSGPSDIHLSGGNTVKLTVTGLHIDPDQGSPTTFTFNFTTIDYANLSCTDTARLTYHKDPKTLPHVSAGPNITITLPQNTAVLNGSKSWDDFGITSYQWTRSDNSPAAGIPLLDSDTKPVLILSNLVNGTYNFTLHVTNKQGVKASDTMVLHVLANPYDHYIIQLHLDTRISNFTRSDLQDLGKYLSLSLNDYTIHFQGVYESAPHTVVEFYAVDSTTGKLMNVSDAWKKLTENGQDYKILHYHVVQVEMKECQLSCSGHGSCDKQTKRCRCDVFWMENPFSAHIGRHESNCEWSVFYVVLLVLGVLLVTGVTMWLTCWCCLRKRNISRSKRRIRYAIHDHGEVGESKRMLTKGQQYIELKEGLGHQHSSLMQSESETEEEIFDSSKKRSSSPPIRNNKLNSEKYGKNSSLVNTVIPK